VTIAGSAVGAGLPVIETMAGSTCKGRDDTDTIAGSTGTLPPTAAMAGSAGKAPKLGSGGGACGMLYGS
jgi:hypothetical protein